MTTAKITCKDGYTCAPDGVSLHTFSFAETVTGQVAEWAIADGAASRMFDPRTDTQAISAPETKAKRERRK